MRDRYSPVILPPDIGATLASARDLFVLTGAGMSAESGVPTFRDPVDGLWERYDPNQLVSVEGWAADPDVVWAWHLWFASLVARCQPNAGHRALGQLADRWEERGRRVRLATQNIDDLHERGGSRDVAHLHGEVARFYCETCGRDATDEVALPDAPVASAAPPACPACAGLIRPAVTWFGEALPAEAIDAAIEGAMTCDAMLVIGTSGAVYPAAGLPAMASGRGVPVIEINPHPTELSASVDHVWRESAATALPALVRALP